MSLFQVVNPNVLGILCLACGLIYRMPFSIDSAEIYLLQLSEKMEMITKTWCVNTCLV